ncbi:hypothetical protein UUR5_0015 [Ureaplasma urealyticum serovar 5 str. ATCC 27817]|nr:hypothetical protein UUR5_0015 [Ureaplasma urealyticum serovar 5 str. ATCC 27817]
MVQKQLIIKLIPNKQLWFLDLLVFNIYKAKKRHLHYMFHNN